MIRPILFSGPMVRALLAGTKTQTRRIVKPPRAEPILDLGLIYSQSPESALLYCPYGQRGDRLWVRETHAAFVVGDPSGTSPQCVAYKATCDEDGGFDYVNGANEVMRLKVTKWTPSIHMPRWASRITLEITSIRVERLQSISEADAKKEGVEFGRITNVATGEIDSDAVEAFESLWESLNGPGSWDENPWGWVIEFKKVPQ